ncbi:MAG: ATP synthase F0 subunit B [Acidobacteriaceae bacterium]
MKRALHLGMVLVLLLGWPSARLVAQATPTAQPATSAQPVKSALPPRAEKVDAPESNKELEAFRHSPAVQSLARRMGLDTELTAKIFEDLNSAIMIGAILWLIFRFIPNMYRKRSEVLDRQILDAALATSRANERLAVVEERLSKLDVEIAAIREQSERDSAEDQRRIHESLESEKQRLMDSVEQEIESAGASARRDLKNYAASLAIERAMSEIRLTEDDDRALIRSFGKDLYGDGNGAAGSRNGERN